MSKTRSKLSKMMSYQWLLLALVLAGLMVVWANSSAQETAAVAATAVELLVPTPEDPAGLYVQEPNFGDLGGWQADWNSWAAGAMVRVYWGQVETAPGQYHWDDVDDFLAEIPSGKKAVIGIYFKESAKDCYYGIPSYYYGTGYGALQLKKRIGNPPGPYTWENVTRTCTEVNGTIRYISTAVDFMHPSVKAETDRLVQAFITRYKNHPKVAAFEFATGAAAEATPWAHPGTALDNEGHSSFDGWTYEYYYEWSGEGRYSVTAWARHNYELARTIDAALPGGTKRAFMQFAQWWPASDWWSDAVRCIAGQTTRVCNTSTKTPITSGFVGIKHSGLKADTVSGGEEDGTNYCGWWLGYSGYDYFKKDPWKMMRWVHDVGQLKTDWEFNNYYAIDPLTSAYGVPGSSTPSRDHVRYSLAMGLSFGADVMLVYVKNTQYKQELEWAKKYVGKSTSSAPNLWIVFREAIENVNEENWPVISGAISDPEDATSDGDGDACLTSGAMCNCGHDIQTGFGIQLVQTSNTTEGRVNIDDTVYGATARRAYDGGSMYLDVDNTYMQNATEATILIRYKLNGAHPSVKYKQKSGSGLPPAVLTAVLISGPILAPGGNGLWYEAVFQASQPDFSGQSDDIVLDSGADPDWFDYVEVQKSTGSPTATPTPTLLPPTATPTATLEPSPNFRERMEATPPATFSDSDVANGAALTRVTERWEGNYGWKCQEGSQLQNWPECWASKSLSSSQPKIAVEYAVRIDAATQLGPILWAANGGLLWPYFDLSNQLHVYCSADLCGTLLDYIPGGSHTLARRQWYRIRMKVDATGSGNNDSIIVTAFSSSGQAVWTYAVNDLNMSSNISSVQMLTRFGIDNNWDENAYWDDFRLWWGQLPSVATSGIKYSFGEAPRSRSLQQGVDSYQGGQDTYIVTTTWETPTPHGSHPNLYVRTNNTDGEVMSSLLGFDDPALPLSASLDDADLAVYFLGQSVNGGTTTVHVAGLKPDWEASTATWLQSKAGASWQAAGAKGANDRTVPGVSRLVDYTEVGTWLVFDVTSLVKEGYTEFILYGEHQGVNKAIYFSSNDYWDTSKHPQLTIRYNE